MKRFRFVARVAAVLGVLVIVVVVAVAALMSSEGFSRWLVETLADRSNDTLRVESVSGTLGDTLRMGAVFVEVDAGTAVVRDVELALEWRSLLARSVVLDFLRVRSIRFEAAQLDSSASEVEPSDLDLLVLIRELEIDEIQLLMDDSNYTIVDTSLGLRLLRNRFELEDLTTRYGELAVSGRASLTLAQTLDLDAEFCVDGVLDGEAITGCIDANGDTQELALDAQLRSPFTARGSGTVALSDDGPIDIDVTWQDAMLNSFNVVSSPEGSLELTGTMTRPRVVSQGSVIWSDEIVQYSISASLGEALIQVDSAMLSHQAGSALLTGEMSREFESGRFEIELQEFDPAHWVSQWPGLLDATASVRFTAQDEFRLAARDVVARGELRGYPLTAVGEFSYGDDVLSVESLQVVSRTDRIVVAGRLGSELDLDVEAIVGDLGFLGEDFSGALSADLQIMGTSAQPLARGEIDLTDFSYGAFEAETLQITGNAGMASDDPFNVAAAGIGVRVSGTAIDNLMLNLSGSAAAHRVEAQLVAGTWTSRLVSDGAITDRDWRGRINEFEFVPNDFGFWRLRVPAEVRYGAAGYSVSELCLTYELSSVCAAVSVAGTVEDTLDVSAVNFDVSILAPFMPAGLQAKGLINASGNLSNFAADPRGRIELGAMDAQVDILLADDVSLPIPIAELAVAVLLDDAGATLSARVDAAESGSAAAALIIDDPLNDDSALRGSLNLAWEDVSALSVLSPEIEGLGGRLDAQLAMGGSIAAPALNGSVDWSDGTLEVPAWGLVVDAINASIEASERREAEFSAQGLVDANPVEINGIVLLDPDEGWPMRLELRGQDLSLVQLAEIEMHVSPNLEADVRLPQINVTGNVEIPYARIRDVVLPEQAITPSADTVIHGVESEDRGRPLDLIADLVLNLGDDVTYEDANLTAAVTGALNLDYRSGQGAAAQGALTLTGQYDAYGNPLTLERGQLIFVGPLADPSLDILAVREIGEVTAGVQLTGTLRNPITTLFSDPAMSEADALGWLLFGRPLASTPDADSAALRSAALSMGLQQALPVIERIGETLRLDDFAIRNTATDAGALMAGKYLSPKLYFRYSYGLFNRIGGLLLRYRIDDRFSLETRSGEHNSMDLLYTVEKD